MSFVRPDQTMMCFATDLIIACLSLQINKDLGTVFCRQLNRLVSFFNYMSTEQLLKWLTIERNSIVETHFVDTTCFCRLGSLEVSLVTLHASLPYLNFSEESLFCFSLSLHNSTPVCFPGLFNEHNPIFFFHIEDILYMILFMFKCNKFDRFTTSF